MQIKSQMPLVQVEILMLNKHAHYWKSAFHYIQLVLRSSGTQQKELMAKTMKHF